MRSVQRKTIQQGDYLNPNVRPPAQHLPKAFAKIAAERDDIEGRKQKAARELLDLNQNWRVYEDKARRSDADAGAKAARAGTTLDNPMANVDALRRRKEELENEVESLGNAHRLVLNDYSEIREAEKGKPIYAEAVAKAQARMQAAANELRAAAAEAGPVLGVYSWVCENGAYDGSTSLVALEVAPGLARHIGDSATHHTPVSVEQIANAIEAFASLSDPTTTEK